MGAGSGLLSLLKLKKDSVAKLGDGMDSDQEDSANSWVAPKHDYEYVQVILDTELPVFLFSATNWLEVESISMQFLELNNHLPLSFETQIGESPC